MPDGPLVDLAFIDADKTGYQSYLDLLLPRLSERGLIVVDNVLWGGSIIDDTVQDANTVALRAFNDAVAARDDLDAVVLADRRRRHPDPPPHAEPDDARGAPSPIEVTECAFPLMTTHDVRSHPEISTRPPSAMAADLLLGPALRYVSDTEATIWVETTAACSVRVLDTTTRTFEVAGHHYALVIIDGLRPASVTPYDVHLDERPVWPPADSRFPPSVIRTMGGERGTCRCSSAAVGRRRRTSRAVHPRSRRGRATAVASTRSAPTDSGCCRMPMPNGRTCCVFLGDQVYADDMPRRRAERPRRATW